MSAAGVRAMASVLHEAQALGARIVFCRFVGPAVDCLEVSGFAQLLDVAESLEEASARLESPAAPVSRSLHPRRTAG
jgi:anti-sigma B factor antagonist